MTLCIVTGRQCVCQPDEAMWCPEYKPDWYAQCLMRAIVELRLELAALRAPVITEDVQRMIINVQTRPDFYGEAAAIMLASLSRRQAELEREVTRARDTLFAHDNVIEAARKCVLEHTGLTARAEAAERPYADTVSCAHVSDKDYMVVRLHMCHDCIGIVRECYDATMYQRDGAALAQAAAQKEGS